MDPFRRGIKPYFFSPIVEYDRRFVQLKRVKTIRSLASLADLKGDNAVGD